MTDKEDKGTFSTQGTGDDGDLWEKATKGAKKLKKADAYIDIPLSQKKRRAAKSPQTPETGTGFPAKSALPPSPKSADAFQTDHRTDKRLKRGEIEIEGKLDLHGLSRVQAYDSLVAFLLNTYSGGKKCVLVITGKGSPADRETEDGRQYGILRENLPEWIKSPPLDAIVLKIQEAHPRHGGKGAFYVLLRKKRGE